MSSPPTGLLDASSATAPVPSMDISPERTVYLISSDKKKFKVSESVARQSQTLAHTLEDLGNACSADNPIPTANVDGKTLGLVLVYCKRHADPTASAEDLNKFDERFVKKDQLKLRDLIWAANYLEVKGLLDILCQKIADMMAGMKPDEIRDTFGIENDFSPEEYEKVYNENKWAFEDLYPMELGV